MSLFRMIKHALVKDTRHVSETDEFLAAYDKKHPRKSASQLHEIAKHRNIFNRKTDSKINWR